MIRLDTANPAYSFRSEILALVKRPPGYIALKELSYVMGLCGTYELRISLKGLIPEFRGLTLQRRKGTGTTLQCTQEAWPTIEYCAADYLRRLEAGRRKHD